MTPPDLFRPLPSSQGSNAPPRIRLASPDIGEDEIAAVRAVLTSGILTNGPATAGFEADFAARHEIEYGVAFANGTVALAAMYLALGIGAGDEVIVPSLTFISSATSVLHVGAIPVFADISPDTFNVDPSDVAKRITERTKAILAVHYGGQAADMAELQAIADDAGIVLLEDAAEAHGATYRGRSVGGLSRAAMFSFTPTKNITTGEGGMVTTDDGELAQRLRLLRNHGQTSLYRHGSLGWNWRISELQAAVGRCQVAKLDQILERKRQNATWLTDRLGDVGGLRPPQVGPDRDHVFMLYTVLVNQERDSVLRELNDHGIEARVYFPPAHTQPLFSRVQTELPVTDAISRRILSIPFHSRLSADELEDVASNVIEAVAAQAGR